MATTKVAIVSDEQPTSKSVAASTRIAARAAARAAAERAVASVDVGVCKVPGEVSGRYAVAVSFAASGVVVAATVDPTPYGGSNTAGCIEERMRELMVPPFDGAGFMVNRSAYVR